MIGGISPESLFIFLIMLLAIVVLPFWHIFRKAGFSPWLSVFMVVPVLNLALIFVLAFGSWPSLKHAA